MAFRLFDARLDYTHTLDRLSLTPNAELSNYQDGNTTILGAPASQSYRDRNVLAAGVTARYELMPLQNALLVLRGTATNYLAPQAGQPSRKLHRRAAACRAVRRPRRALALSPAAGLGAARIRRQHLPRARRAGGRGRADLGRRAA